MPELRRVTLFAFPQVQILDVTGPLEVFAQANRFLDAAGDRATPRYLPELVAVDGGVLRSSGGLGLVVDATIGERQGGIDTLLMVGGAGVHAAVRDAAVVAWLGREAAGARRVGSICTGTFLLAATGLLDGCRAVTHWRSCALLAERHPAVIVEADAIWVKDGKFYSSAGVTAGMDLALAMVEEDCGQAIALDIARNLVLYLRRAGGQSQYSAHLLGQAACTPPIKAVQVWLMEQLGRPIAVAEMADRACMSPRHFARVFTTEIGMTPARYLERARVDAARHALDGGRGLAQVAAETGFPSADTMRRAFIRHLGVPPSQYRERFG